MPPSVPGIDPLEGLLLLGPDNEQGGGVRIAVARKSGSKPYSLLLIDRDRDGSFGDEEPLLKRSKRYRGRRRSLFETSVRVAHTLKGSPIWQEYPIAFWMEVNAKRETPAVLFYRQRGVSAAEIDLNGFVYDVILADGDHDGVLETSDWWTLRPALSSATQPRRLADFARARGFAWKLELLNTAGTEGRLVRYEASDERVREPRRADRLAPRAVRPLSFTNQVEMAITAAAERGVPYFLNFGADWCAPCRRMDELVYTAEAVVDAAGEIVCIKVGNDATKLKRRHRVTSYPTGVLFRPDGSEIDRFRGYRGVRQMTAFFHQARASAGQDRELEVEP